MQIIEPELRSWLADFVAARGTAVMVDLDSDLGDVVAAVQARVSPSLSITTGSREAGDVVAVKRVGDGRSLWFALNLSGDPVTVTLRSGGDLRELPLDEGQPTRLRIEQGHYVRHVAPFESFMLASDVGGPLDPVPLC